MSILQSFLLGLLQGITEFLPISSSGHLIIVEKLFGLKVEELKSFDVALHLGTLIAILGYFRKDFIALIGVIFGKIQNAKFKSQNENLKCKIDKNWNLIKYLIIGSIPAIIAGLLLEDWLDANFRNANSVGIMMIVVGILFIIIEYWQSCCTGERPFVRTTINSWRQSLIIGLAQAMALIPGVSRSGATMAAGIAQGIKREESARFSFLLGSIAIAGAAGLTLVKIFVGARHASPLRGLDIGTAQISIGFMAAMISGFFAISFLMKFLKKYGLTIFGVYRVAAGIIMLGIL